MVQDFSERGPGGRAAAVVVGLALFAALTLPAPARAQDSQPSPRAVAFVDRVEGESQLMRGAVAALLTARMPIDGGDVVRTGTSGRAAIVFRDATRLLIGADAEIVIDEFAFASGRKSGFAFIDVVRGPIRLTTGAMGKLADRRIEVRLPGALLRLIGTDLWAGPVPKGFGVMLLEGRLEVRNDRGVVTLSEPRSGTVVAGKGTAPSAPHRWSRAAHDQALSLVSFGR